MRRLSARRGISYIASVIIVLALVLVGSAFLYNYMNSTANALAQQVDMTASATTAGNTTYIEIQIRNTGTRSVVIKSVWIDNTNVTNQTGLANYTLEEGRTISKIVSISLPPGDHIVKIVFADGSEKLVKFTV